MMDWVMGAYSGIKAASDITQSMLTLKTDAAVTTKVIELNGVLLGLQGQLNSAHSEQSSLSTRVRELESELAKLASWEEEKQRYFLHQFSTGTLAYKIQPSARGDEPEHCICSNCYQKGIKSLLQARRDINYDWLGCHTCDTEIRTEKRPHQALKVKRSSYY